ncbi:unnamed protein product [Rhodiola kirilowii]
MLTNLNPVECETENLRDLIERPRPNFDSTLAATRRRAWKTTRTLPQRQRIMFTSSRNRKSVNYMSEVEADDMNMSTENIEESCAGEEQVNLASAYCPQDLSQLDTDQICTPSAINVPGVYLKMGGGFCIDEED